MLPPSFSPQFLNQLELLKFRARRAFLGLRQGGHLSPKKGHGIEFSDYRRYEPGDNPRWIDWGVYGRSDKLYVRRYQEEQNISVLLVIDDSASMILPEGNRAKWEFTCEIALALAYVALMQHDSVHCVTLGNQNSHSYHSPSGIYSLGDRLWNIGAVPGKLDLDRAARFAASRIRSPGIAVVISDLLFSPAGVRNLFTLLRSKNLDLSAVQVLGPQDIDPLGSAEDAIAVDAESGEEIPLKFDDAARSDYRYRLEHHNREISAYLNANGIRYTCARADQGIQHFAFNALPQLGLIQ